MATQRKDLTTFPVIKIIPLSYSESQCSQTPRMRHLYCHRTKIVVMQIGIIYLPTTGGVYFCPARKYSIIIVNATVVRLRVVYMGTFTPRTDSTLTTFQEEEEWLHISYNQKADTKKVAPKLFNIT